MAQVFPYSKNITTKSTRQIKHRILKVQFGDGYSQVAPDGLNYISEVWSVELFIYPPLIVSDATSFLSQAVLDWFWWRPPSHSITLQWRVQEESLKIRLLTADTAVINVMLEQIFTIG